MVRSDDGGIEFLNGKRPQSQVCEQGRSCSRNTKTILTGIRRVSVGSDGVFTSGVPQSAAMVLSQRFGWLNRTTQSMGRCGRSGISVVTNVLLVLVAPWGLGGVGLQNISAGESEMCEHAEKELLTALADPLAS